MDVGLRVIYASPELWAHPKLGILNGEKTTWKILSDMKWKRRLWNVKLSSIGCPAV